MFIDTVKTPGLAQLSYVIGDGTEAAVIDPRRDIDAYLAIARRRGVAITHVFETHRNEDLVSGAAVLGAEVGAAVHHGAALDFGFGNAAAEGETFSFGGARLQVLETPGHTLESLSFVLHDEAEGGFPVAVFTGDCLFVQEVGRTDFYPDRAEEVAGMLYDSIHDRLLPLGGEVLLFPAHGHGSVCGGGMAKREFSSLGLERLHNPRLQLGREDFIAAKTAEWHAQPPYFRLMERLNLAGASPRHPSPPEPQPVDADTFAAAMAEGLQVVDLREPEAIAGAFIPGSLPLPAGLLTGYAGFFLDPEGPIGLVADRQDHHAIRRGVTDLFRIGYDRVTMFLADGLHGWETAARGFDRIGTVSVQELLDEGVDGRPLVVDVRKPDEWTAGHLAGARHVFLGELEAHLDELPRDRHLVTFCGSGQRAIVAAGILRNHGYEQVSDCLGSMSACRELDCALTTA